MKVFAVIPVFGRQLLLPYTIGRLYNKNKVDHVICVGSEAERAVCEKAGAQYMIAPNVLGLKWNNGFEEAGKQGAEVILFVGSSDWLSDNWLDLLPYMETYDMIGKLDFNMVHFTQGRILLCNWPGYPLGNSRHGEAIGIGRILRAEVLKKFNWRPFRDNANESMDYQMLQSVKNNGGKLHTITEDVQSLSISTDLWVNKHRFFDKDTKPMPEGKDWVIKWFPEALDFYEDINNR